MVRTTAVLCKIRYALRQRDAYRRKGVYRVNHPPTVASRILDESRVPVLDPVTDIRPPPPEWVPPKGILPDFRIPSLPEKSKSKKKPIWHLSNRISFTEGIDQACLLTKSQRFDGLPPQIERLVDKYSLEDQDEKVKDAIRHAVLWNNTKDKLGKRIDLRNIGWNFNREFGIPDSKSGAIILNNFMRLSQSFGGKFPELTADRLVLFKPSIETAYQFHDETIEILSINEFMVTGGRQLTQLGNDEMIKQSVDHKLFDMYPVLPTVDFVKTNKYVDRTKRRSNKYMDLSKGAVRNALDVPSSCPQIVFRISNSKRSAGTNQAFNLMTTFGIALTEASNRYGCRTGKLDVPVTVMNINASYERINFIVFQLNTLDFENDDGIKNFAWFDTELMFRRVLNQPWLEPDKKLKPPEYKNYNNKAFSKFLAMYLYDHVD